MSDSENHIKRQRTVPRWQSVEFGYFEWLRNVCGRVAFHWCHMSFDMFVASGIVAGFPEARQERLRLARMVPGDQIGHDGVAMYDRLEPVQVKNRTRPIGPEDLGSTFLSISRIRHVREDVRTTVASTSGFTSGLAEMGAPEFNLHLETIDADVVMAALDSKPGPVAVTAPFQLRQVQIDALAALRAWLDGPSRLFLLGMPPGSGKTLTVTHFLAELSDCVAAVASPTRFLVKQTEAVMRGVLENASFVLVGSDGTTDSEAVLPGKSDGGVHVVSTTFDSAAVVVDALRGIGGIVIVVVDEAQQYSRDKLHELCALASKVILVSGTPEGIPMELLDEEHVEFRMTIREAVDAGYIVPCRFFYPLFDENGGGMKAQFFALGSVREDHGPRRPIVFTQDTAEAKELLVTLVAEYASHGLLAVGRSLFGTTSERERASIKAWFEGGDDPNEVRFIVAVHVPDCGLDFPRCDGIFLSSISNPITAIQRICRGVRRFGDKTHNTVMVFCGGERAAQELYQLGLGGIPAVRHLTVTLEDTDVAAEKAASAAVVRKLKVLVESRGTVRLAEWCWWQRTDVIESLGGFKNIKVRERVDDFIPSNFMSYQRELKRAARLSPEQIERLEALGIIWEIDTDAQFLAEYDAMMRRGEAPKQTNGHSSYRVAKKLGNRTGGDGRA